MDKEGNAEKCNIECIYDLSSPEKIEKSSKLINILINEGVTFCCRPTDDPGDYIFPLILTKDSRYTHNVLGMPEIMSNLKKELAKEREHLKSGYQEASKV